MGVTAVVGANWGDEGKGKMVDALAASADLVVRFQGGANAGHTVVNQYGKFALHLLPAGVFHQHVTNVLGPGVALDPDLLLQERDELLDRGVPEPDIRISDRAQVVMPYHVILDECEEERLGSRKFGSTRTGIAPFYADKYLKLGVQVGDLYHPARLQERIEASLAAKNILLEHLYGRPHLVAGALLSRARQQAEQLEPFVCNTTALLQEALVAQRAALLEGQLGALRDPDHGVYPYPTSSSTLAGFAAVGAGVPPWSIARVIAVTKAYSTCVGAGPLVAELEGDEAAELRERGGSAGEYGATTGRPRRVGWFDCVATRYGCRVQGATELAVSLLDVLGYLDGIPVCVAYRIGRRTTRDFPIPALMDEATPICEELPGWRSDIRGARTLQDLPAAALSYLHRIQAEVALPVRYVSVGPERDALIGPVTI
jgi:adenylosuccinate synthase